MGSGSDNFNRADTTFGLAALGANWSCRAPDDSHAPFLINTNLVRCHSSMTSGCATLYTPAGTSADCFSQATFRGGHMHDGDVAGVASCGVSCRGGVGNN